MLLSVYEAMPLLYNNTMPLLYMINGAKLALDLIDFDKVTRQLLSSSFSLLLSSLDLSDTEIYEP